MKKINKSGFTLIELIVVISVIGIIILGSNLMNYQNISNKQALETKTTKIVNIFENIRNNALLGKGIGTDLIVPSKYRITFITKDPSSVKSEYYDGTTYKDYNFYDKEMKFSSSSGEEIYSMKCLTLSNIESTTIVNSTSNTGTIIVEGSKISLGGSPEGGACINNGKILDLEVKRGPDIIGLEINTLNGLIKIKK